MDRPGKSPEDLRVRAGAHEAAKSRTLLVAGDHLLTVAMVLGVQARFGLVAALATLGLVEAARRVWQALPGPAGRSTRAAFPRAVRVRAWALPTAALVLPLPMVLLLVVVGGAIIAARRPRPTGTGGVPPPFPPSTRLPSLQTRWPT